MRTLRSARKPPRPSIDNPKLVIRMKPSVKKPSFKHTLLSEEMVKTSRRQPNLTLAAASASNAVKVTWKKSESQSLSVSWIDSLRSFKVRGSGDPGSKTISSRKSPRNNASLLSTSTLRSNSSYSNLSHCDKPTPQQQSLKSSSTPIQSFKFRPTNISDQVVSKKQTPMHFLAAPAPTLIGFGRSFTNTFIFIKQ